MLIASVLGEIQWWSSIGFMAMLVYLTSITFFTYLFVNKTYKISKMQESNIIKQEMLDKIVQCTVLITVCCFSSLLFTIFLLIAFLFEDDVLRFVLIVVGTLFWNCDVLINYISIVFQFYHYNNWYYTLFSCLDKKMKNILQVNHGKDKNHQDVPDLSPVMSQEGSGVSVCIHNA